MAYTTSTRAVAAVPACINQAINFLTRPLILTEAPDLVVSLQSILRSTLQPAFQHSRDSRLILSLTPTSLPPRPLYAACIACGLQWADWIRLLGAREFDLIIEANAVSVTYHGAKPQTITFWSEPSRTPAKRALLALLNFEEARVPISKLGQQSAMQASLKATVNSAIAATTLEGKVPKVNERRGQEMGGRKQKGDREWKKIES
ncbi:hypothetical protein NLJ89_g2004 [Agrocybe chaxingu]|uniref:Uncharacterized protein n=1 Tax=Agrocybe chaxingu TaxID=84603 RepID=A0A9W8K7F5_9AGAR|nr:hypothetical protein NLJ89_g2004 [Agrocybe chaxingu]